MGLDIRVSMVNKKVCPHCGKEICNEIVFSEISSGRVWYDWLEKVGYYSPYKQLEWYGKDMELTSEQAETLYDFLNVCRPYNADSIEGIVARAIITKNTVVINADW